MKTYIHEIVHSIIGFDEFSRPILMPMFEMCRASMANLLPFYMQLEGSPVVLAANDRFDATMTNIVTWNDPSDSSQQSKEIESNATIQVGDKYCALLSAFSPCVYVSKAKVSVSLKAILADAMLPTLL